MFFTPELLARRDSGFGLIWLAATLGSKSAFKKLPRRSVVTADITQLCDLISQPAEPLALRLSSNLMFGVVRVYKVKQEIFMADVTNCVTALKKVVQEINSKAIDAQLQMAQASMRPSAVTIAPDARAAHVIDYEAFVTNWDEYLNIIEEDSAPRKKPDDWEDDANFDPANQRTKKSKSKHKPNQTPEGVRGDAHTLEEHHEHLLSASFDISFVGSGSRLDVSSSQVEPPFDFDENLFDFSDGLDIGDGLGLGDDLARELGWGSPERPERDEAPMEIDHIGGNGIGFAFDLDMRDGNEGRAQTGNAAQTPSHRRPQTPSQRKKRSNKENVQSTITPTGRQPSVFSMRGPSPAPSFSRQFLSQDLGHVVALQDITEGEENRINRGEPKKTKKRTRLLLDARTELTDEELKIARAQYLEFQNNLKQEQHLKRAQKHSNKLIEDLLWGVPKGIQDPALVDFWQTSFKVQIEAKSGLLSIHDDGEPDEGPPAKRLKTTGPIVPADDEFWVQNGFAGDVGMVLDTNDGYLDFDNPFVDQNAHRRSSEEPGQARRISRPSSIFAGSNLDLAAQRPSNGSQRSSLFPWDNAGASSSSGNPMLPDDGNIQINPVDIGLRGSSQTRKSSIAGSQTGVAVGGLDMSPIPFNAVSSQLGVDYEFNVDEQAGIIEQEETQETQKSDSNLTILERNSYNFLEYAKMQYRTLPQPGGRLSFGMVVPKDTSTRHVAAAAFYHCLVLATKDLVRLEQKEPHDMVIISII